MHHRPLAINLFFCSRLWHVQGGYFTPTLLPDMHPPRALLKCSPTPGSQGTFSFAEFRLPQQFQENYALEKKRTMKFQYMEKREMSYWKQVYYHFDQEDYLQGSLFVLSHQFISVFKTFNPSASSSRSLLEISFNLLFCFLLKNVSWSLTAPALLISLLINRHCIKCHQCKGFHVNLAGPRSMDSFR